MIKYLRRVGVATALIGTVLAVTLFIPASAAQASCSGSGSAGNGNRFEVWFRNGVLGVKHWNYCHTPPPIAMDVTIERLTVSHSNPGIWVIVAQGRGDVSYTCRTDSGDTVSTFRVNGGRWTGTYACY